MNFTEEKEVNVTNRTKTLKEIEETISKAIKKVGAKKENELCKYLPMTSGGYMHHFTLKKMKKKEPKQLGTMITRYIIETDKPKPVAPKQRAPRGSRKRRDQITFNRIQLERMLNIARLAGDKEIIQILSPKKSLATYKRELIQSIRHEKIEPELWNGYVESIQAKQMLEEYQN
ncbi:MAG: hypothetical protein JW769_04235 [Parachlamydiales bacterium]|nr:hypothetical protein [Parachlamydiales bacterium]